MKTNLLVSLLLLSLVCCRYDPFADKYTTEKPTQKDVVGVYDFDFQTVAASPDNETLEKKRSEILIKSKGTFEIRRLPVFKENGIAEHKCESFTSRTGKWTIGSVGRIYNGFGGDKTHWGLILDPNPNELRYVGLLGKEKVSGIVFSYGDPDSGDVMIFTKK